jgi:uncharacterized Ntn-hydrolase superfamily protein
MTFSIVASDLRDGSCGVAVASKFLAVGAVVPFAKAGVGAIATQAMANLGYGKAGLKMVARGMSAQEAVNRLTQDDEGRETRQLGIVDAKGNPATFTGRACFDWAGGRSGRSGRSGVVGYAAQGNILSGPDVVPAMCAAFENTDGALAQRLLAALQAGDATGGDRRGRQSAALLVVRPGGGYGGATDRWLDLRVDDHPDPLCELARLFTLHDLFFGQTAPADKLPIDDALGLELLRIAAARGHHPDPARAALDAAGWAAIDGFIGTENLEERVDLRRRSIDPPALAFVRTLLSL